MNKEKKGERREIRKIEKSVETINLNYYFLHQTLNPEIVIITNW